MSEAGKSKIALQLYKKGEECVAKNDYPFAVDCFLKCTRLEPDKLIYRRSLRAAECKMYGYNGTGAKMAGARMAGSKMKLKAAKTRKKWHDVINAAEECLRLNPWDASMQYEIGVACREIPLVETGVWVMEAATSHEKSNADLFRLLAELYEMGAQYGKAVDALAMVKKLAPNDHEAAAKMRQLAANDAIQRGKYEEEDAAVRTSSAQEADEFETEEEVAESPEDRARREIARLEEKVTETPDNVNLYVQIADAYRRLDEFDKAAETYQRAIDASGGAAPELTISMLDCRIEPLRKNLSIIKSRFDKLDKNAPANAEEAKKLQQQFQKYNVEIVKREIELYQYRVKMKPEDYTAHYELGNRYRMLGQYDEAIRALQKGRNDQRHKADALCWLGFAFWKKKNYALAETNLKAGLEALAPTNEEGKKRIEYFLGRVSEDRGDQSAAVEHYNSIAAIDYDYKDVATRLDRLNAEAQ